MVVLRLDSTEGILMGDIGLIGVMAVCFGAVTWLIFDTFLLGAVGAVVLWFMMGRK